MECRRIAAQLNPLQEADLAREVAQDRVGIEYLQEWTTSHVQPLSPDSLQSFVLSGALDLALPVVSLWDHQNADDDFGVNVASKFLLIRVQKKDPTEAHRGTEE